MTKRLFLIAFPLIMVLVQVRADDMSTQPSLITSEASSMDDPSDKFITNWVFAECTGKLIKSFKNQVDERSGNLHELSKRVIAEKKLYIKEVTDLSSFSDVKMSLDFVKDEQIRHRLERLTPLGFAERLETLKPTLSPVEWDKAVRIWARYLDDTSEAWKTFKPETACGFRDEMKSLGMNTFAIVELPALLLGTGDSHGGIGVIMAPLAPVEASVSLASDVVTAVPSVFEKHISKLRYSVHRRSSIRSFRKFAKLVLSYEQKYHKLSGHPQIENPSAN